MSMEQERGISISATCMTFVYNKKVCNVIDTPGHSDFSEDTYRALSAADNALMLIDGGKGIEGQTRKLFKVCRMRGLPIFTFVNKMDRPATDPVEIIDDIEKEFGLETWPVTWPIGDGDRFRGLVDRVNGVVHLYTKAVKRGGGSTSSTLPVSDVAAVTAEINDKELSDKLFEDLELLEGILSPLDPERVRKGEQSPMFFGSAINDFGVDLLLDHFTVQGSSPSPRPALLGETAKTAQEITVTAGREDFTAFVFKMQANLDLKHRDRLAYVRVVSGKYEKGMKVKHSRSKQGKTYTLAAAQALFGQDRETVESAYPGDVIGINNPGLFSIGDTLFTGPSKITFPGIPSFSPEKFSYIRNPNPSSYKSFSKGLTQLLAEGAIQMLRPRNDDGSSTAILAAVGELQFEVVTARLKDEYGVAAEMEPLGYSLARWANGGWPAIDKADAGGKLFNTLILEDQWKRPVVLFRNDWKAADLERDEEELELVPYALPPPVV